MSPSEISIVVPAYQAEGVIADCVHALAHQTVARDVYEILIVDDGSTDETVAVARAAGADRVLTLKHQGPAGARNAGVEAARGEIVLFTDADCVPAHDWIEKMTAPFEDPVVDGVKGVYRTRQRSLVARFVQLEYEDKYDKMRDLPRIDFVDTYAAAYRRAVFDQQRGFDPAFPRASGEDIELSYRLSQLGYTLVFAPDAAVYHRHPATVRQYLRRKYYVGFWRVRMYRLHPDKMIDDSHTPQLLKVQIALMALLLLSLALALLLPRLWPMGGALLAALLLTTLPFEIKAIRRDPGAAWTAPWLLLLRALVLGLGFAAGLIWAILPLPRPTLAGEPADGPR